MRKGAKKASARCLEQLAVKFDALNPDALSRIENASADQLKVWLRRVVTADSLAAVFDD